MLGKKQLLVRELEMLIGGNYLLMGHSLVLVEDHVGGEMSDQVPGVAANTGRSKVGHSSMQLILMRKILPVEFRRITIVMRHC